MKDHGYVGAAPARRSLKLGHLALQLKEYKNWLLIYRLIKYKKKLTETERTKWVRAISAFWQLY